MKTFFKILIVTISAGIILINFAVLGIGLHYYLSHPSTTHTTSASVETVKEKILKELAGPLSEYRMENMKAVNRFAKNLLDDLRSLKANIPEFVDEVTSINTTFKYGYALLTGDDNRSEKLVEGLVKEHLINSDVVVEMILENLEGLENDLAYNRNRLYASVQDVLYREMSLLPLSGKEMKAMTSSVTALLNINAESVARDAVFSSVLKEIGSIVIGEVASAVVSRIISRIVSVALEETVIGASLLAASEGSGIISGIVGLGVGFVVFWAVDSLFSDITEKQITEKTELMIDNMAHKIVYDEEIGLYFKVKKKVNELTEQDIANIYNGVSSIGSNSAGHEG